MKKVLMGAVIGMATAIVIQTQCKSKCWKKMKKAVSNKIEDILE